MLWRVRTTLPDRPGSLAVLAQTCGEAGVNILGLQIFPGVEGVTDELVLRAPDTWGLGDVAALIEEAGGAHVTVAGCTEHALVDGPIQYLHGLRRLAHDAGEDLQSEDVHALLAAVPGEGRQRPGAVGQGGASAEQHGGLLAGAISVRTSLHRRGSARAAVVLRV